MFYRLIGLIWLSLSAASAADLDSQRLLFQQAQRAWAAHQTQETQRLLESVRDYPLYPALAAELIDLNDNTAVESFLAQYGDVRAASQLRRRWLEQRAAVGDWPRLFTYIRSDDDKSLQCLYRWGQLRSGQTNDSVYDGALDLWMSGQSLPASCAPLFNSLRAGGQLSDERVWQRFNAALDNHKPQLAAAIADYLPPDARQAAGFWLKVYEQPRQYLGCAQWPLSGALAGDLLVRAIERLAAQDARQARRVWLELRSRFVLTPAAIQRAEQRLALAAAQSRHLDAYDALAQLSISEDSPETRTWRLRAALLRQDWPAVLSAWQRLSEAEKNQAEWRYWQARAFEQLGDKNSADLLYREAAEQREFFGFLAADRAGVDYAFNEKPLNVDDDTLLRLQERPALRAVAEWRALGHEDDARAEWNHALKHLPTAELPLAAKLAQRWGWDSVAIFTAARAEYWDDFSLRFPLAYRSAVENHAARQQIDPSLVFGLIRQESAFDAAVQSAAGARGLMQIMPATGATLARALGERFDSPMLLHDPDTNLRYGTAFLRDLLDRYQRNAALAAAAYNAGPGRVARWLPPQPLPADAWLEQIPFKETRHYVDTVLSNFAFYQARLNPVLKQRVSNWLPDVPAGSSNDSSDSALLECRLDKPAVPVPVLPVAPRTPLHAKSPPLKKNKTTPVVQRAKHSRLKAPKHKR